METTCEKDDFEENLKQREQAREELKQVLFINFT